MISLNDEDEALPIDPLAPKEAPLTKPMFGEKAYAYTLDRMRDLQVHMASSDQPNLYRKQYAYYEFVKTMIETLDQEKLEKEAGQSKWRKRT
jgi:hypothetical protein